MTMRSEPLFADGRPSGDCPDGNCRAYRDRCEKQIYDLQQILEISRSLCSTLEFSKLVQAMLDSCMTLFLVQAAGCFLVESMDSDSFVLGENYVGLELDPSIEYKISSVSPLASALESNRACSFAELEEALAASENARREEDEAKLSCDMTVLASLRPTLIVPLLLRGHLEGIIVFGERIVIGSDGDGDVFSDYEKARALEIASLAAIAINNAILIERSSTDMMTHLKLKYYFFNALSEKLEAAVSDGDNLAVLMFDIDYFKKFNDTYGHACGDYVLQSVAAIISSGVRSEDIASRYGGEEFTVMLTSTGRDEAMAVAERIRSKVEEHDFLYEKVHVSVTISVGVSVYDARENPVESPKMLVEQADRALYASKRAGRNRVTFAAPEFDQAVAL